MGGETSKTQKYSNHLSFFKNKVTNINSAGDLIGKDEFTSKEDPISDKALAMKGDVDTQTT